MGIIYLTLLVHKMGSQISATWELVRHADPLTQKLSRISLSAFPGVGTERWQLWFVGCLRAVEQLQEKAHAS